MTDLADTAEGEHYATWAHGYDEGRRHGHKECQDEIARLRAEVGRLSAARGEAVMPALPPPLDAVALAREARDAYRKIVESSRPSGQPNGLVVPRIPLHHWLGPKLDRLCAALGVDDAGPREGGEGRDG